MTKVLGNITSAVGGISDSQKEGQPNAFDFGRSIDFRSDSKKISILPKATKESGTVITGMPKWAERISTNTYVYDEDGALYKRTSTPTWTKDHIAADSSGNGLAYFGEDDYLYYTQDKTIGRYGPISGTAIWYDDFRGSEGGAPTNTHSLDLEADSSQYASRADTASLSIVSDLTLSIYVKPESLPTTGNSMTLISKWDESGTLRSYKMDISTISNFFGDGGDGALTVAADTTEAPIDSACTGTIDTKALTATNASFAAGQQIMIIQSQGTNVGTVQYTEIQSYTAGTITTVDNLSITYGTGAQVRVMKEYTDVTINANKTYTSKVWDGTVGGILAFYASGTVTINGTITASEKGFRGGLRGTAIALQSGGGPGEGNSGYVTTASTSKNGTGAGGGGGGRSEHGGYGGGGGHATAGTTASDLIEANGAKTGGEGGDAIGVADLTQLHFGGGGGGGGVGDDPSNEPEGTFGYGGIGGGIICIFGATFTMGSAGALTARGQSAPNIAHGDVVKVYRNQTRGGHGGGGSILLKSQIATLKTELINAYRIFTHVSLGTGADGRIHLDYLTSFTGTTTPALDYAQDDNLGSGDGYSLRLGISSTGLNSEHLTWDITNNISTTEWARWAITWDAADKTATFYKNGVALGTDTGALTAIHDNASAFVVGANENGDGDMDNFFDGLMDDVRVWNDVRTATELTRHNDFILNGYEPNLMAYYKLDNDYTDSEDNGNNDLTATNAPVFSTDVPFSGLTTRADLDQSLDTNGNTYTLATAIAEGATHRQTFVPAKDPQKSIQVNIDTVGTGNWTVTVHDALNRELEAVTVAVAEIYTGDYEFIFDDVWRPVIGATYHFHVTSSVADGEVVTTDTEDLETADYHSYYQFLVTDTDFHPIAQMLNFLAIGNERYLATWDATTYTPHKLTFPSGNRVRALGFWREYLAIGTWKGTNITDFDKGRVYFWDGTADTYNFYIDIPEGGVNALLGTKGALYIWAGYNGDILMYSGGLVAQKIKRVPKVTTDKYVEVFPGAVDMWRSLVHFGVSGNSDSSVIEKGVYTWGSLNRNFPDALGFDYPCSHLQTTGTGVKIGMVQALGQQLLIGWQNGTSYAVDNVAVDASPYLSATYESLITDLGKISQKKYPLVLRVDFEPLATGETVNLKYKADRETSWKTNTIEDTVGARSTRMIIKEQINEVQLAVDLATSVSTSPVVTGISLESEAAQHERLA